MVEFKFRDLLLIMDWKLKNRRRFAENVKVERKKFAMTLDHCKTFHRSDLRQAALVYLLMILLL